MMTTTMLPPSAATPKPVSGDTRFVSVRANLLPEEVLSTRQAEAVRKKVLAGLIVFAVLLVGWYGLSWWQTNSANNDLSAAQRQGQELQSQQNQFAPLVTAQAQTNAINGELKSLMSGDLSWKKMLTTLRTVAPARVEVNGIAGTVTVTGAGLPGAAPVGPSILNNTDSPGVGQLTITGSALDKRTIAAYADALTRVKGLAGPLITNVSGTRPITFTIAVVITSDALGGRYSSVVTTPTTTGGQ
jgi:hypothetical protein